MGDNKINGAVLKHWTLTQIIQFNRHILIFQKEH